MSCLECIFGGIFLVGAFAFAWESGQIVEEQRGKKWKK